MTDDTTDIAEPTPIPAADHVIDMGDWADAWTGQTITVRPYRTYAASTRIEQARAEMKTEVKRNRRRRDTDDVEVRTAVTPLDFAAAVVEESVISWTLRGVDGQPLTADRAGLLSHHAPAVLVDCAIDAIEEFYDGQAPKLKRS